VYGPVCTVVWEGEAARPTPIPIARSSPARRGGGIGRQALNDGIRTVVLMAVPAEDDDGWQVEFEWDEGQRQRVLHFASKKDAELWIADPNL